MSDSKKPLMICCAVCCTCCIVTVIISMVVFGVAIKTMFGFLEAFQPIRASGKQVTRTFTLPAFEHVDWRLMDSLSGKNRLIIEQGDVTKVTLESDEAWANHLNVTVTEAKTLVLYKPAIPAFQCSTGCDEEVGTTLKVTTKNLKSVTMRGSIGTKEKHTWKLVSVGTLNFPTFKVDIRAGVTTDLNLISTNKLEMISDSWKSSKATVEANDLVVITKNLGSITLSGSAITARYEAKFGNIEAMSVNVPVVDAIIGQSTHPDLGDIKTNASDTLNAEINGGGNVYYWGNATVTVSGSGKGRVVNLMNTESNMPPTTEAPFRNDSYTTGGA